jgi:hypothetical protein
MAFELLIRPHAFCHAGLQRLCYDAQHPLYHSPVGQQTDTTMIPQATGAGSLGKRG